MITWFPFIDRVVLSSGGELAPSFGGRIKNFHGATFLNDVFSEKISIIFTAKISDDLFLVIDQVFRFFYSVRTFARIRQHYFSKYWGDGCMGPSPTPHIFWGTVPPSHPLGFRPWNFSVHVGINLQILDILICSL